MGEKLATSILESPYCYSNNASQIINNRKKVGSTTLQNVTGLLSNQGAGIASN